MSTILTRRKWKVILYSVALCALFPGSLEWGANQGQAAAATEVRPGTVALEASWNCPVQPPTDADTAPTISVSSPYSILDPVDFRKAQTIARLGDQESRDELQTIGDWLTKTYNIGDRHVLNPLPLPSLLVSIPRYPIEINDDATSSKYVGVDDADDFFFWEDFVEEDLFNDYYDDSGGEVFSESIGQPVLKSPSEKGLNIEELANGLDTTHSWIGSSRPFLCDDDPAPSSVSLKRTASKIDEGWEAGMRKTRKIQRQRESVGSEDDVPEPSASQNDLPTIGLTAASFITPEFLSEVDKMRKWRGSSSGIFLDSPSGLQPDVGSLKGYGQDEWTLDKTLCPRFDLAELENGFEMKSPSNKTTTSELPSAVLKSIVVWNSQVFSPDSLPLRDENHGNILQPETRPISQEQLGPEVMGTYVALCMVEEKCVQIDNQCALTQAESRAQISYSEILGSSDYIPVLIPEMKICEASNYSKSQWEGLPNKDRNFNDIEGYEIGNISSKTDDPFRYWILGAFSNSPCSVESDKFEPLTPISMIKAESSSSSIASPKERAVYSCTQCDGKFHRMSDLTKHMKYHSKLIPCPLPDCSGTFSREQDLKRHQRGPHKSICGGEEHHCPYEDCQKKSKTFTRRDNLLKHMKRIHDHA